MRPCFFATDLHGRHDRYRKLFAAVRDERPSALFLGGDLLPHAGSSLADGATFVQDVLAAGCAALRAHLGEEAPRVYVVLGNDDPRGLEPLLRDGEARGLWEYVHGRKAQLEAYPVYGYACVPPTPFRLKDWERYDVSRYVDPGCVSPEEGLRTVPVHENEIRFGTIAKDLDALVGEDPLQHAIFLLHSPPYGVLDRAALDGTKVESVPVDVHIGSIAITRFIESRQPLVTLHGHVHESARLEGTWRARIGRTQLFSAAHDGSELALVRFDPADPDQATRELL